MRNKLFAIAFGLSLSFAQETPEEDPAEDTLPVATEGSEEFLDEMNETTADGQVVDKPHEPKIEHAGKGEKSSVSFGIRAGINFSHTYTEWAYGDISGKGSYGDIFGMQAGFVVDFALNDWLHLQPGLMYIQKGMKDKVIEFKVMDYNYKLGQSDVSAHYIELPLLLSFKLDMLRLNAGPYFSLCPYSYDGYFGWPTDINYDIGLSAGIGADIGMFYIGAFYDYGFANMNTRSDYKSYNRTLGFNLGVNL